MGKKIILNLPLLGTVNLSIQDQSLFNFTHRQLQNYIIGVESLKNKNTTMISCYIDNLNFNNLQLSEKIKFEKRIFNFTKEKRTHSVNYNYLYRNKRLDISVNIKKNFLFFINNFFKKKYSINHYLFYSLILYPIFSLYAIYDNYYSIHGSLIKTKKNSYFVLTGLDGIGKSSLSVKFENYGNKILADNFLLFNGNNFVCLNLPVRLDIKNFSKNSIIYQNNYLKEALYKHVIYKSISIDKVYFLLIGESLNLTKMNQEVAFNNWNLINNGAGEILDSNLFSLPFFYQNSLSSKKLLSKNIKFYALSIPYGDINNLSEDQLCQLDIL